MYIGVESNERDLMENRWVKEGVNQKEMERAKLSMGMVKMDVQNRGHVCRRTTHGYVKHTCSRCKVCNAHSWWKWRYLTLRRPI